MYQGGQRHVSGNDPTRPFQLPPPPPPPTLSPPMVGPQMNMTSLPPPPPMRYPAVPQGQGVMIPPPPGPPPGSGMMQSQNWHGNFGRLYDGRPGYSIPPPPPATSQHQPYNPTKFYNAMQAGHAMAIPPPPRPNDGMGATYIPTGETYGEGVGIPGFGREETQNAWQYGEHRKAGRRPPQPRWMKDSSKYIRGQLIRRRFQMHPMRLPPLQRQARFHQR